MVGKLKPKSPDYIFVGVIVALTIFGLVMLSSASFEKAKSAMENGYFFLTHQIVYGLSFGILGFLVCFFVPYRAWERLAIPLLLLSVVLLGLVLFSRFSMQGNVTARRWLDVGFISFQPSELMKLSFLVYLGAWIAKNQARGKKAISGLLPFLFLIGGVTVLLVLAPATTVAVLIFATSLIAYFVAGAHFRFLVVSVLIAALGFSALIYTTGYRTDRIFYFLNPNQDVLGKNYQREQAVIAIGSGGMTGAGFGQSTAKLNALPEPLGDSIFAVIAEELGFVGSMTVVFLFFLLVWRGLSIARASPDVFGRVLAAGFTCMIGLQAFVNMGAISGLIPLTGVPLPFISYGGTALAVFLTMSGIVANISRYRR